MIKQSWLIYTGIFVSVFFYAFINPLNKSTIQPENQPPVVKIINPKNNSLFDPDARVNYEISVADKEDGNSKYDEINAKEVLLEVRYVENKAKMQAILNKGVQADPPGLALIRPSNCFNCHSFNGKSIGPSFYEISKRYPQTKHNIDSLVKHIVKGSTGVWGKEKMPSHPELTHEEAKNTVQWILKYGASTDINYYTGLKGMFSITGKKGIYVLIASYTDHGLKSIPDKRLKGQDMICIYSK